MQKVFPSSRSKAKPSGPEVRLLIDSFMHFSLPGLLPADQTLALNGTLGTLSCLSYSHEGPRLIAQQLFTSSELSVLRPLLESYPDYCPYEVLMASFSCGGHISETTVVQARQRLQEALEREEWDQELRPLRNVLSRTRLKLRDFGIEISSILETGYILMVPRRRKRWD